MKNLSFLAFGLLFSSVLFAETAVLRGQVQNADGSPLADVQIKVNEVVTQTDSQGNYRLQVKKDDVYQLQLSKGGFYPSVQTFSRYEIGQLNQDAQLAPIQLVTRKPGRTLFAFGGDVMMGRRYSSPLFGDSVLIHDGSKEQDTRALLQAMQPYLQLADYASVNLETQLGDENLKKGAKKSVTFYSPPETLQALSWAGVDYVSLGNNHTFDFLDIGLESTMLALEKSGLAYSGAGYNEQQALKPYVQKFAEHSYSLSAFVGWSGSANPNQVAETDKGGAAFGTDENILNNVKRAKAAGHIPLVQYHGSNEYTDQPTLMTEQRLKFAIDAGAALAIAHHPHVTQGLELYKGKLIAYSMGNFVFDQYFYATSYSMLLYVWMDGDELYRSEIVPIYLKGYQPTPAVGLERYTILKRLKTLSAQRQTFMQRSGGHSVIDPARQLQAAQSYQQQIQVTKQQIQVLNSNDWSGNINAIQLDPASPYRLGHSLSNGGDFEGFNNFLSPERGWQILDGQADIIENNNNHMLQISKLQANAQLGMKAFRRVFQPGAPTTFTLDIQAPEGIKAKLYWQARGDSQGLRDALNSEKHLFAEANVPANKLTTVSGEFYSPRVNTRSIRVFAEFDGQAQSLLLDNVHLIEWSTAYSQESIPSYMSVLAEQASFIGFPRPYTGKIDLTLK